MLKHGLVMYDALYAWRSNTPLKKASPGCEVIRRLLLPDGVDDRVLPLLVGRALHQDRSDRKNANLKEY